MTEARLLDASVAVQQLINGLAKDVHAANQKWWYSLEEYCQYCPRTKSQHVADPHPCTVEEDIEGTRFQRQHEFQRVRLERNTGEMLMLMVSELAEAMEGDRKNLMDDKLPHRPMIEVELADAVIRIFDFAAGKGLDLGGAFVEKMTYNEKRHDHTVEGRLAEGGKKY